MAVSIFATSRAGDVETLIARGSKRGRPTLGSSPASVESVRLHNELRRELLERAQAEGTSRSRTMAFAASPFEDRAEPAAWKVLPAWAVVASADRAIDPDAERFMGSRAGADTIDVDASHSVARSRPAEVAELIREALLRTEKAVPPTNARKAHMTTAPPIVLIHGLWMTPLSWEHWIARFEKHGHQVLAPGWPGMEGDINELRRDPSAIEHLGITEIVDHYDQTIRALDRPPVIMGHSFGGLITQILVDRGLGAAAVAIDSAAAKGVTKLPPSEIKSGLPVLKNPANNHRAVALTPEEFHYAFTNTLTEEESQAIYERYAVPGPGRVLFQGALANFNPHAASRVDYHNDDRCPLLFIAGGEDHVIPASVNEANAKHYRKSNAVTDFKEFPGRSHYTLGQEGWEEVADYAIEWAAAHAAGVPAAAGTVA